MNVSPGVSAHRADGEGFRLFSVFAEAIRELKAVCDQLIRRIADGVGGVFFVVEHHVIAVRLDHHAVAFHGKAVRRFVFRNRRARIADRRQRSGGALFHRIDDGTLPVGKRALHRGERREIDIRYRAVHAQDERHGLLQSDRIERAAVVVQLHFGRAQGLFRPVKRGDRECCGIHRLLVKGKVDIRRSVFRGIQQFYVQNVALREFAARIVECERDVLHILFYAVFHRIRVIGRRAADPDVGAFVRLIFRTAAEERIRVGHALRPAALHIVDIRDLDRLCGSVRAVEAQETAVRIKVVEYVRNHAGFRQIEELRSVQEQAGVTADGLDLEDVLRPDKGLRVVSHVLIADRSRILEVIVIGHQCGSSIPRIHHVVAARGALSQRHGTALKPKLPMIGGSAVPAGILCEHHHKARALRVKFHGESGHGISADSGVGALPCKAVLPRDQGDVVRRQLRSQDHVAAVFLSVNPDLLDDARPRIRRAGFRPFDFTRSHAPRRNEGLRRDDVVVRGERGAKRHCHAQNQSD